MSTHRNVLTVIFIATIVAVSGCSLSVKRGSSGGASPPPGGNKGSDPYHSSKTSDSYVVHGKRYGVLKTSRGFRERGIASWYGKKFHGRRTSSGEIYDMYKLSAAHKHLPLPTFVKVTNLENGRTAVLRVNDRGPFHDNRVIDLSYAAALKLDIVRNGTALVDIMAVDSNDPAVRSAAHTMPEAGPVYLQIGAFNERPNAMRLSQKVTPHVSNDVRIHEGIFGSETIYRVQIGPIRNADFAERLVATLTDLGIREHHFVSQ